MNAIDPNAWAWVVTDVPPARYDPTWITPLSYLIPMPSGATLRWVYDEDHEGTHSMVVRLTEQEAQKVFDAKPSSGMLESVRSSLHWRGALMFVTNPGGATVRSWRYFIQPDIAEDEFVNDLMTPPSEVYGNARQNAAQAAQMLSDIQFAVPLLAGAQVS